jgi:CxC6 like cysteine cluster associated with KDZ transposases
MDVDGEKKVIKMVVMDGIVMGPTCCAFDGCEGALVNARGQGNSFCIAHTAEFQNRCHVHDCQNDKFGDSQACQRHHNEWYRYTQS